MSNLTFLPLVSEPFDLAQPPNNAVPLSYEGGVSEPFDLAQLPNEVLILVFVFVVSEPFDLAQLPNLKNLGVYWPYFSLYTMVHKSLSRMIILSSEGNSSGFIDSIVIKFIFLYANSLASSSI